MKKKIGELVVSICLLVIGTCLFLWAEKVTDTVSIIFGVLLMLYSVFNFISGRKEKDNKTSILVYSAVLFVAGLILVIKPGIITETISFVIGGFLLIWGFIKLKKTIDSKGSKNYNKGLILSIIEIVIGILCLVGKLILPNIILKFVGLMLVIYALVNIVNTIITENK